MCLILLIAIIYSQGKNKKKKCRNNSLIKSTVYLLIFLQNSINFEGSSNSLTESYFIGELGLGES